jgi:hypothetical protein
LIRSHIATLHHRGTLTRLAERDFGDNVRLLDDSTAVVTDSIFVYIRGFTLFVRACALGWSSRFADTNRGRLSDWSYIAEGIGSRGWWRRFRARRHCE